MAQYQTILVTGGAGFVGSNVALWLKLRHPDIHIMAADNLRRRGSEANLPRLREHGVEFVHCDIRNPEDLRFGSCQIDLIVECSADPSVLAGYGEAPDYVVNTNLVGTINCLELVRRSHADLVFLSTSRVYPVSTLNSLETEELATRVALTPEQTVCGASAEGISERFPLEGIRSLYGATKLCSELLIQEYGAMYGVRYKVDQGVFALWMAMHYFKRELSYIGWGGHGKQVRDLLHVDDLAELIEAELTAFSALSGETFNVGGGLSTSLSLLETTQLCQEITGNTIPIWQVAETRPADLKLYISDNTCVKQATGWSPRRSPREILTAVYDWIREAEPLVRHIWVG
jgi:CDP-paratose 2-epimerase